VIGAFSTPFARVVRAALAARRRNNSRDVDGSSELVEPELRVLAISQKGWPEETMTATVESIVLVRRDLAIETVVQALRTQELTPSDRAPRHHVVESRRRRELSAFSVQPWHDDPCHFRQNGTRHVGRVDVPRLSHGRRLQKDPIVLRSCFS
jgi:hypothetical protein